MCIAEYLEPPPVLYAPLASTRIPRDLTTQDCSNNFHESLRHLPNSWCSFLSSIVSCLRPVKNLARSQNRTLLGRQRDGPLDNDIGDVQGLDTCQRLGETRNRKVMNVPSDSENGIYGFTEALNSNLGTCTLGSFVPNCPNDKNRKCVV